MRPTFHEIQRAAYDRWERRGGNHGNDPDDWYAAETELTFLGHFRIIAEYAVNGPRPQVLGDAPTRRCRFCERTSRQVDFGDPRPIVPDRPSPLTAEVCRDCRLDWGNALDDEFIRFWERLTRDAASGGDGPDNRGRSPLSVAAFKAMVAGALSIVPDADLPDFVDTIEWLSNPDHDLDDRLLGGAGCRIYRAPFLHEDSRASLSLARRIDDDAPVPYMLYFLAGHGIMVQIPLPLCLRDQDLDGRDVEHPERALSVGSGHEFRAARCVPLPLVVSNRRANQGRRLPSIAS
jgi:Protein of unknown function (DUF2934)